MNRADPRYILATWAYSGLSPKAPGTVGSLAALPVGVAIGYAFGAPALLAATALVFGLGVWASGPVMEATGRQDPGFIVIDEVAGQWLALTPLAVYGHWDAVGVILAFIAFRFFDIIKPWPVSWADRSLKGAWGVMVDDVLAGIYAALPVAAYLAYVFGEG